MSEKKIDLEKLFEKHANCHASYDATERTLDEDAFKEAMLDFGKQLLELAAENAINQFWGMHDYHGDHDCFKLDEEGCYTTNYTNEDGNDVELSFHFDKQCIIDTINQI